MITIPDHDLGQFESISLAELQTDAAFLTRMDRKYLVPLSVLASFLAQIEPETRVLEHHGSKAFGYQSAYFDDEHLSSYHAARCRRAHRFKVRTRQYLDSGECLLEVKLRDGRGRTVKYRSPHDDAGPFTLVESERGWLQSFPLIADVTESLDVQLLTHYQRSTLLLPEAAGRVTIDRELAFSDPMGHRFELEEMAVIETKGAGRSTTADRLLWRLGYRPVSLSKYAVGMSVMHPDLPANRWHRLRRTLIQSANHSSPSDRKVRCV